VKRKFTLKTNKNQKKMTLSLGVLSLNWEVYTNWGGGRGEKISLVGLRTAYKAEKRKM